MVPHKHFRLMLREDAFLQAGLHAVSILHSKQAQKGAAGVGASSEAEASEIYDEMDDEIVRRTMGK